MHINWEKTLTMYMYIHLTAMKCVYLWESNAQGNVLRLTRSLSLSIPLMMGAMWIIFRAEAHQNIIPSDLQMYEWSYWISTHLMLSYIYSWNKCMFYLQTVPPFDNLCIDKCRCLHITHRSGHRIYAMCFALGTHTLWSTLWSKRISTTSDNYTANAHTYTTHQYLRVIWSVSGGLNRLKWAIWFFSLLLRAAAIQ